VRYQNCKPTAYERLAPAFPGFVKGRRQRNPIPHLLIAAGILFTSTACSADGIVIENAWVRMAPPGAMSFAGYMTIDNPTDADVIISSASASDFEMSMMHETVVEDGLAKMKHHEELIIPAGGSFTFEPNGYHLMLMRPTRTLEPGDEVTLTFQITPGESASIDMPVRAMVP
jgi:copper(I)-binding protein